MMQYYTSVPHGSKGLKKHQTIRLAVKGGNLSNLSKKEGNSFFEVKSQFL